MINKTLVGLGILFLVGILMITFVLTQARLSVTHMDVNLDHRVTIDEFFQSLDLGLRTVRVENRLCDEVYRLKDGAPLAVHCSWPAE